MCPGLPLGHRCFYLLYSSLPFPPWLAVHQERWQEVAHSLLISRNEPGNPQSTGEQGENRVPVCAPNRMSTTVLRVGPWHRSTYEEETEVQSVAQLAGLSWWPRRGTSETLLPPQVSYQLPPRGFLLTSLANKIYFSPGIISEEILLGQKW